MTLIPAWRRSRSGSGAGCNASSAGAWPTKPKPNVERWTAFLAEFDDGMRCIFAIDRLRDSGATEITPKQFRDAYAAVEL